MAENTHPNGIEQARPETVRIQQTAEAIRNPAFAQVTKPESRPPGKLWPEVQQEGGKPVTRTREQVRNEYVVKQGDQNVPLVDHLDQNLNMFLTVLSPAETANLTAAGVLATKDGATTISTDPEKRMQFVASLIKQVDTDGMDDMAFMLSGHDIRGNDAITCLQALGIDYAEQAIAAIKTKIETTTVRKSRTVKRQGGGRLEISSKFSTTPTELELSNARSSLFAVDRKSYLKDGRGIRRNFDRTEIEFAKAVRGGNYGEIPTILHQFDDLSNNTPEEQQAIQGRLSRLATRLMENPDSRITPADQAKLKALLPNLNDPAQFREALSLALPVETWTKNLTSTDPAVRADAGKNLYGALYDWGQVVFGREGMQRTVEVDLRMAVGLQDVLLPPSVRLARIRMEQAVADARGAIGTVQETNGELNGVMQKLLTYDSTYTTAVAGLEAQRQMERRAILIATGVKYEDGTPAVRPEDVDDATRALAEQISKNMDSLRGTAVMGQNRTETAAMLASAGITLNEQQLTALNGYLESGAIRSGTKSSAELLKDMGIADTDPNYAIATRIVADGRRVGRAVATLGRDGKTDSYAKTEEIKIGGTVLDMGLKGVEYLYRQGVSSTITEEKKTETETKTEKGPVPADVPVYDVNESGTATDLQDLLSHIPEPVAEPPAEAETGVKPPETEVKPPETEVKPPEAEVKPPETEVKPPEVEVKPPETEVKSPEAEEPAAEAETGVKPPGSEKDKQPEAKTPEPVVYSLKGQAEFFYPPGTPKRQQGEITGIRREFGTDRRQTNEFTFSLPEHRGNRIVPHFTRIDVSTLARNPDGTFQTDPPIDLSKKGMTNPDGSPVDQHMSRQEWKRVKKVLETLGPDKTHGRKDGESLGLYERLPKIPPTDGTQKEAPAQELPPNAQPEGGDIPPELFTQEPPAAEAETGVKPPETEVKPPEVEVKPPEAEAKPPEAEVKPPEVEVKPPKAEVKPPEAEVKPPEAEVKPPEVEVKPPETEVKPPEVEVKLPEAEVKPPEAEEPAAEAETGVKPPEVEVKPPEAEVKPPETEVKPPETEVKPPEVEVKPPEAEEKPADDEEEAPPSGGPATGGTSMLSDNQTAPPSVPSGSEPPTTEADATVKPPEVEVKPPEAEVKPPEAEVPATEAETGVKPPETEVKPPEVEVKPPEAEVKPPEVETKPPEAEVKAPEAEVKPPEAEVKPPEAEQPPEAQAPDDEEEAPPSGGPATGGTSMLSDDQTAPPPIAPASEPPAAEAATDVKPPEAEVKPPEAEVKPPGAEVKPPEVEVKPPEAEVKPPEAEQPAAEAPIRQADLNALKQKLLADAGQTDVPPFLRQRAGFSPELTQQVEELDRLIEQARANEQPQLPQAGITHDNQAPVIPEAVARQVAEMRAAEQPTETPQEAPSTIKAPGQPDARTETPAEHQNDEGTKLIRRRQEQRVREAGLLLALRPDQIATRVNAEKIGSDVLYEARQEARRRLHEAHPEIAIDTPAADLPEGDLKDMIVAIEAKEAEKKALSPELPSTEPPPPTPSVERDSPFHVTEVIPDPAEPPLVKHLATRIGARVSNWLSKALSGMSQMPGGLGTSPIPTDMGGMPHSEPAVEAVLEVKPPEAEVKPPEAEVKPPESEAPPAEAETGVKPPEVEVKPPEVEVKPPEVEVKPPEAEVPPAEAASEVKPPEAEVKPPETPAEAPQEAAETPVTRVEAAAIIAMTPEQVRAIPIEQLTMDTISEARLLARRALQKQNPWIQDRTPVEALPDGELKDLILALDAQAEILLPPKQAEPEPLYPPEPIPPQKPRFDWRHPFRSLREMTRPRTNTVPPTEQVQEPPATESEVKPPEVEVKPPEEEVKPVEAEAKPPEAEVKPPEAEVKPPESEAPPAEAETGVKPPEVEVKPPEVEVKPPEVEVKPPEAEVPPAEAASEVKPPEAEVKPPEAEVKPADDEEEAPPSGGPATGGTSMLSEAKPAQPDDEEEEAPPDSGPAVGGKSMLDGQA